MKLQINMISKQIWITIFFIIIQMTNSEDVPNNLSQILEHLLSKSNPDLSHNISYLPQIFQGTIILNINYPESKPAINIFNSPNQKNKLCNCNKKNNNNEHQECNCNEKQNYSNFAEDTNKDFENNRNKELVQVLQTNETYLDNTLETSKYNETNTMNLTLDRANFNIEVKVNHDDDNQTNNYKNNILLNNSSESDFFAADEVATNLLSKAFQNIETVQKMNFTDDTFKASKKIDRLRDLTVTNSTVSYLQKMKDFAEKNIVPLTLFQNNSTNTNVQTKNAIIQESIINFQQYIPPLLNYSFVENLSDTGMNSGLNILCPFPAKCVYLMYCTVNAKISNTPVILNVEEEKLRRELLDCVDEFTGRTGKCCMDPISGD